MDGSTRTMIDLHCHLLAGIDDGPPDSAAMIAMARAHLNAGVDTVACTPHVNWSTDNRAASIAEAVARTRAELEAQGVPLRIVTGGEVALTRALELPDEELRALRLGGGPWLLLEAPLGLSVGVEQAVAAVAMRGLGSCSPIPSVRPRSSATWSRCAG